MQTHANSSQDCSTDFFLSGLTHDHLAPFSPFADQSFKIQTPLSLMELGTTHQASTEMQKVQLLQSPHEPLDHYIKPNHTLVSSSSASSEFSSVCLQTPSHLSSVSCHSSEDWFVESLSNLDVLAPTVPDLSFSFVTPQVSQPESTPHQAASSAIANKSVKTDHQVTLPDSVAEKDDSLKVPSDNNTNSKLVKLSTGDGNLRQTIHASTDHSPRSVHTTFGTTTPSLNGGSSTVERPQFGPNRRSFCFLTASSKFRNSTSLENQLDCLAQSQSPTYNNNIHDSLELDMAVHVEGELELQELEEANSTLRKDRDASNLTSGKEAQRRKSRFLKLSSHSSNTTTVNNQEAIRNSMAQHVDLEYRQRRQSTSFLLDRANNFFGSTRSMNRDLALPSQTINVQKAWLDPTLSKDSLTPNSGSRVKSSRSLFSLFSKHK